MLKLPGAIDSAKDCSDISKWLGLVMRTGALIM